MTPLDLTSLEASERGQHTRDGAVRAGDEKLPSAKCKSSKTEIWKVPSPENLRVRSLTSAWRFDAMTYWFGVEPDMADGDTRFYELRKVADVTLQIGLQQVSHVMKGI